MFVQLLGPLRVLCGPQEIAVPAAKQRAILAALAMNAGQVVSHADLVDAAWDGLPPPSADVTLRNYIARLRRQLGDGTSGRIVTRHAGLVLDVARERVDVFAYVDRCKVGGDGATTG